MTSPTGAIGSIYISLVRRPYRFVSRRRISGYRESYEVFRPPSLGDFVAGLLNVLSENSPTFMETLAQVDDREFMASKHKTRRYIADRKDLLYIDNPRLADKYARSQSGYWFITNIGAKEAYRFAHMAAEAAKVPCETISKLAI